MRNTTILCTLLAACLLTTAASAAWCPCGLGFATELGWPGLALGLPFAATGAAPEVVVLLAAACPSAAVLPDCCCCCRFLRNDA